MKIVGDFEREFANGHGRDICYIPLPSGDIALYIDLHGSSGEIYFAYQDYQGSILAIADDNGGVIEEYSYDAWGNRRDALTLENNYYPTGANGVWQGFFHRGYTSHEHIECFGLINMNGRLYDPLLGRMLSPDKYVQAPDFSQNFNRYSYAWNNPLTYSDPSGDIVIVIAGAVVGAYIGGIIANDHGNPFNKWDWESGSTYAAMGLGAVVGGLTGLGGAAMIGKSTLTKKSGAAILSKTGGKKLFSSMVSGTVNTINNYDGNEGLGWHTLGHFSSGALGGAIAVHPEMGLVQGMVAGGFWNAVFNSLRRSPNDEDFMYNFSQDFVGGALSVAVGAGFAKAGDLAFLKSGTKAAQLGKKSLWYGGQNVAADFAYSNRDDFDFWSSRTLGMFGAGALGGIGQDYLANTLEINTKRGWVNSIVNGGLHYGGGTGAALTADMTLTFLAKGGYSSFYRKARETKTGYLMYKTLI